MLLYRAAGEVSKHSWLRFVLDRPPARTAAGISALSAGPGINFPSMMSWVADELYSSTYLPSLSSYLSSSSSYLEWALPCRKRAIETVEWIVPSLLYRYPVSCSHMSPETSGRSEEGETLASGGWRYVVKAQARRLVSYLTRGDTLSGVCRSQRESSAESEEPSRLRVQKIGPGFASLYYLGSTRTLGKFPIARER